MRTLKQMLDSKRLYFLVGISILYFLIKGFRYLTIGSFFPMAFILSTIFIFIWTLVTPSISHRPILKGWAVLIIVWAMARLSIWLILELDSNITESHLREQFGLFQNIISLMILSIGFGIIIDLKRSKSLHN